MSYFTRGDFTKNLRTSIAYSDREIKRYENSRFVKSTYEVNPNATSSYISNNFSKSVKNLGNCKSRYVYSRSS